MLPAGVIPPNRVVDEQESGYAVPDFKSAI
jgi:hypothetical protein